MIKQNISKIINYSVLFLIAINLPVIRIAHSSEFEIEQNIDGRIRFRVLELDDLKAQNIAIT